MTNPISGKVVEPRISLSFEYLKYVFLEVLIVLCSWAEEIRADCLMRFILLWRNIVVYMGRHHGTDKQWHWIICLGLKSRNEQDKSQDPKH